MFLTIAVLFSYAERAFITNFIISLVGRHPLQKSDVASKVYFFFKRTIPKLAYSLPSNKIAISFWYSVMVTLFRQNVFRNNNFQALPDTFREWKDFVNSHKAVAALVGAICYGLKNSKWITTVFSFLKMAEKEAAASLWVVFSLPWWKHTRLKKRDLTLQRIKRSKRIEREKKFNETWNTYYLCWEYCLYFLSCKIKVENQINLVSNGEIVVTINERVINHPIFELLTLQPKGTGV